jgi:hypothetical protein
MAGGTVPGGVNLSYAGVGIREDLADTIYDLFPQETYFLSNAGQSTAGNTLVEWQMDELAAPDTANAHLEGADFSATSASQPTRLKNYTQISRKEFAVTRTFDVLNKAGRDKELTRFAVKKGIELKRDMESILLRNNAATAGAAASARGLAGVETWIYHTQHIKATGVTTGTTPAPSNGVAGTAPTDGTTAASFVEADLKNALEQAWTNGGDPTILMMGSKMKKQFDGFAGVATRFRDVAARKQAEITGAADVYVSSYGSHRVVLSRYIRPGVILCMDMNYWGVAFLPESNMSVVNPGITGDNRKRMILSEYTLVAKNPLASTKLAVYA